jgi:hypothetical protein
VCGVVVAVTPPLTVSITAIPHRVRESSSNAKSAYRYASKTHTHKIPAEIFRAALLFIAAWMDGCWWNADKARSSPPPPPPACEVG